MRLFDLEDVRSNVLKVEISVRCRNTKMEHQCLQCKYSTKSLAHYKIHVKAVHDKVRDLACTQCEYKTSHKSHLRQHARAVHEKIKDWKCDKCDYKTTYRSHLKSHMNNVHKVRDLACPPEQGKLQNWACGQCDHRAASKSDLQVHLKVGHSRKKHKGDSDLISYTDAVHFFKDLKTMHEKAQSNNIIHENEGNITAVKGKSKDVTSTTCASSLTSSPLMTSQGDLPMPHLPSQPESNDIEILSFIDKEFNGMSASSQVTPNNVVETKHGEEEDEPLKPVDRKVTARMGFHSRQKELYSKCEECDYRFTKAQMQRHVALVHWKVQLEKEDTPVEIQEPAALNKVEKNSCEMADDKTAES